MSITCPSLDLGYYFYDFMIHISPNSTRPLYFSHFEYCVVVACQVELNPPSYFNHRKLSAWLQGFILMLVFYRKHRRLYSSHRVQGSYKVPEGLTCRADMQGVMGWRPRGGRWGLQQGGQSGRGSNEHRWRLKSLTHTTQPAGCHCMQRR